MANTSRFWEGGTPGKGMEAPCPFPHTLPYAALPFGPFFGSLICTLYNKPVILSKRKRRRKRGRRKRGGKGEDIHNQNSPLYINEFELVVKKYPREKISGPDGFTGELNQIFKEELAPILHKRFQKIEEERTLPN